MDSVKHSDLADAQFTTARQLEINTNNNGSNVSFAPEHAGISKEIWLVSLLQHIKIEGRK